MSSLTAAMTIVAGLYGVPNDPVYPGLELLPEGIDPSQFDLCSEYRGSVMTDGIEMIKEGIACRDLDGTWRDVTPSHEKLDPDRPCEPLECIASNSGSFHAARL